MMKKLSEEEIIEIEMLANYPFIDASKISDGRTMYKGIMTVGVSIIVIILTIQFKSELESTHLSICKDLLTVSDLYFIEMTQGHSI